MKDTLLTAPSPMQRPPRCKVDVPIHSCQGSRSNAEAGVTLLELIIVISIVGIMAALAAPGFSLFITNTRISSASNDLMADLMLARSLASTNGHHAVVCPSTNGTSCSGNAADWASGRIVFVDTNADGAFDNGDLGYPTPSKYSTNLPSSLTVTMTGFPNTYIAYNSYGGMAPLGTGSFTLCVPGAGQRIQISINYSGRPSAARLAPSSTSLTCP